MKSWSRKLPKHSAVNTPQCMQGKIVIKSYIFFLFQVPKIMPKEKIIPEYSGSLSTWNKVYCNSSIKASVNEICHAERKKQYLRRSKNSRFRGGKPHVRKKEKERFIPSVVEKFFWNGSENWKIFSKKN